MPNCKNCGIEISEQQNNTFNQMCPECVRLAPIRRTAESQRKSNRAMLIWCVCVIVVSIVIVSLMIMQNASKIWG